MHYQSSFLDMPYPDESGRPCALTFRIAFTATATRLAIIHVLHVNEADQSPMTSSSVRDQVLNRILDLHLRGVLLNAIRLVVEEQEKAVLFPIEVDIQDYIARGNPYDATHLTTARGTYTERVAIRSDSVIAGRARVHTTHSEPQALPMDIALALR
jgi:hypothetical protein